jgi:hypothetical protein
MVFFEYLQAVKTPNFFYRSEMANKNKPKVKGLHENVRRNFIMKTCAVLIGLMVSTGYIVDVLLCFIASELTIEEKHKTYLFAIIVQNVSFLGFVFGGSKFQPWMLGLTFGISTAVVWMLTFESYVFITWPASYYSTLILVVNIIYTLLSKSDYTGGVTGSLRLLGLGIFCFTTGMNGLTLSSMLNIPSDLMIGWNVLGTIFFSSFAGHITELILNDKWKYATNPMKVIIAALHLYVSFFAFFDRFILIVVSYLNFFFPEIAKP